MELDVKNQYWMGKIPDSWETKKIKFVLSQRNENNVPIKSTEILSLTAKQGVIPYSEKEGGGNKPKQDFSAYKLTYPGDIVMNSMNILSGAVGLSKYMGCISPVYYDLKPKSKTDDVRFFYYVFANRIFQSSLLGLGNGILIKQSDNGNFNTIRMRIPIEKLNNLSVPYPSPSIQQQIADYLDHKTAEIDVLIDKINTEIDTLKQYQSSVITRAVTKGLDPNVPMKDSGIEWIGEIPETWETPKLKYLLLESMKYGATESGIAYSEFLPRYIRITDITLDGKLKSTAKLSLSENQAQDYILKDKSILFARSGATVGKTFLYRSSMGRAAFAGYLISANVDEGKVDTKWIYYFTKSDSYLGWVNNVFSQSTIQNISADKYENMPLPVTPDIEEQYRIIDYLDKKTNIIKKIIKSKQRQIDQLSEYKNSLIFEYVTGKKQVPQMEGRN